jgi:phage RecT family recombinase
MTATAPGTTVATKPPATKQDALRAEFQEKWLPELMAYATKNFTPDRILSALLTAAVKNPEIFACTKNSLYLAIMKTARWQLDIGDGVHLVPFNQNIAKKGEPKVWQKVCEAVPDYRGLIALAVRQRLVRTIDAYPVYEGDEFEYQLGTPSFLRHRPCAAAKRGNLRGAYIIILLHAGVERFHYLPIEDIEKRRANSKSWGPDTVKICPPWYAMKTVTRDWLNRQPKSGALAEATKIDATETIEVDGETGEIIPPKLPESTAGFAARAEPSKSAVRQPLEETFMPLDELTDAEQAELDRKAAAEA